MRLLVVEDDRILLENLKLGLEASHFYVDAVKNGEDAIYNASVEEYDLIILDLNLPDMFGLDVLKELLKINPNIKVLLLTAHSEIETKVKGLDLGANDYMVKPFEFEELEARIRMLIRRNYVEENEVLTFGLLSFDVQKRTLHVKDEQVILSRKEGAILEYLLKHQGKYVTIKELMHYAWYIDRNTLDNSIRVHITELRNKLKKILGYNIICNKFDEGYYLSDEKLV